MGRASPGRRAVLAIGMAIAAAGCEARAQPAGAEADPLDGVVAVPRAWTAQPAIADAARKAAGEDTEAAAWGDAGLGCFAAVVATRAERQNPEDALEELRAALARDLGLDGWTATPADARGTIARGGLRGEVRGAIAALPPRGAAVTVAACFHNERDPEACRAQCRGVLDSLDASKVKP